MKMEKMTFEEKSFIYEKSLDDDFKKNNGIFYTDSELASAMVDFLDIPQDATIIDPCCGTGSFIDALQNKGYAEVYGCDFDEKTVRKCRVLTKSNKIRKVDTLGLEGKDTLKKIKHDKFDYVVIDGEAGIEQINRRVMEKVTHLLLVTDASKKGCQVVQTIKKVADELVMYDRIGVIANRIPDMEVVKLMDIGGLELLSVIQSDSKLAQADVLGENVFNLPDDAIIVEGAKKALVNMGIL